MLLLVHPSGIFQYAEKLLLTKKTGQLHFQEFVRKNAANALSILNLILGITSVLCSLNGMHTIACYLLLAGFLFDMADGAVARSLNACSSLGAKLDDFADFTTFGIATSLLLQPSGLLDSLLVVCYVLAVFIRLCFFSTGIPFMYRGLPCCYASVIMASVCSLSGGSPFLLRATAVLMINFMLDKGFYQHDKVLESHWWKKIVYVGGALMMVLFPFPVTSVYYFIWSVSYTLFPATLWS
ncbi:transmembrane protein 269 [Protopterus annectens]|uniref:transmembrane protein 269 n=1 Tax=Protopterus annectens TaxID=7888 RepID=UPI001CFA5DBF|nr:transmembrane protein 269 [Protopterus annectens]